MKWIIETVSDMPISIYGEHFGYHSHGGTFDGADIIMHHVKEATPLEESNVPHMPPSCAECPVKMEMCLVPESDECLARLWRHFVRIPETLSNEEEKEK